MRLRRYIVNVYIINQILDYERCLEYKFTERCPERYHLDVMIKVKSIDNMYPCGYNMFVYDIRKTDTYAQWLDGLRDMRARARVLARVERLAAGNPGDVKAVGEGVSELRIDYGPGYRVYFTMSGRTVIILLAGGDKRSQTADIKTALRLARNL